MQSNRSGTSSGRRASRPGMLRRRRGAAAVELALIAPLLVTMVLGMVEVSRSLLVKEVLNNASYRGCVTGTSPLCDNAKITTAIRGVLSDNNINPDLATITIQVNGVTKDAKLATKNDKLSVVTSIPYSAVTWTKAYMFIPSETLQSENVVMLRTF